MTISNAIAIYSGFFNPIRYGHLQVAAEVQNNSGRLGCSGVVTVMFLPAAHSILGKPPFSLEHRVRMTEVAIQGFNNMKLLNLDNETAAPRTHYERLLDMKARGIKPDYWVIGSDTYRSELLNKMELDKVVLSGVILVISPRKGYPVHEPRTGSDGIPINYSSLVNLEDRIMILDEHKVNNNSSSTHVRKCLAEGGDCLQLLPPNVLQYIIRNGLQTAYAEMESTISLSRLR